MTEEIFKPDIDTSQQALQRSQKFKDAKAKKGFDQIMFDCLYNVPRVYFDSTGEIMCITQDRDYKPDQDWLTHEFTKEEIEMVTENVSSSLFSVYKIDDDNYQLALNKRKIPHGISQGPDLKLVDYCDSPELSLEVHESHIQVTAEQELRDTIKSRSMKIGTARVLSFYVTALNNPHFMIYNFYVPLSDLANKGTVKIPTEEDYTDYSIYTKPVFDSYGRV